MVRTLPGVLQFIFEDPHASRVEIHGTGPDGCDRSWPMAPAADGRWIASLRLDPEAEGTFDFRYLVDGRFWALDEGVRTLVRDDRGHCRSRLGAC